VNHLVQNHSPRAPLCQVQFSADQPAKLEAFRTMLDPLRQTLQQFKFLGGDKLNYADIAVAGNFLVCTIQPYVVCVLVFHSWNCHEVKSALSTTAGYQNASTDFFVL